MSADKQLSFVGTQSNPRSLPPLLHNSVGVKLATYIHPNSEDENSWSLTFILLVYMSCCLIRFVDNRVLCPTFKNYCWEPQIILHSFILYLPELPLLLARLEKERRGRVRMSMCTEPLPKTITLSLTSFMYYFDPL